MNDFLLDHFRNPRNAGELPDADGVGEAGDPGCGAVIRLFIRFGGGAITGAGFTATGSRAAIAAGSLLTEKIIGKPWRDAAALPVTSLARALGCSLDKGAASLPEVPAKIAVSQNAAVFAIEALHAAFEDSLRRGTFPAAEKVKSGSVLVAMSGGVDSSVACLLARDAGHDVTGVTMRLWSDPDCETGAAPSCCSPQAIRDARSICHSLGLPHLTVDFTKKFEREVVDYFVSEYIAGRTPNPCTRCNGRFRFPELIGLADRLGAATVATGHYARLAETGGRRFISRGADLAKDQSYMLWGIEAALLARLEFLLGELTKDGTRRLARAAGLAVHDRSESQEVCFIPDDDYRRFLRSRVKAWPGAGEIVDTSGEKLGRHDGFLDYTVGQRRGLGVSAPKPLYVLKTLPEKNQVVAGTREELAVRRLTVSDINSFIAPGEIGTGSLQVQVRYNSGTVPVQLDRAEGGGWRLKLEEPVLGVAPGQSAVLYDGDRVVAGGVIASALA